MPDPSDQTPQEPEQPEVVAHDSEEEQPLWCVLNSSCGSVSVQE
jgi:hypothetical protein